MNNNLGLILAIVVLAALAAGAYFFFASSGNEQPTPESASGETQTEDASDEEASTSAAETDNAESDNGMVAGNPVTESSQTESPVEESAVVTVVENCANASDNMTLSSEGDTIGGNPTAVFETSMGTFKAELYTERAPVTACNFVKLIEQAFFDGLIFHRVIYEVDRGDGTPPFKFVIQGGDPNCNNVAPGEQAPEGLGCGEGGSGETIPLEIVPELRHDGPGMLSMARTNDPNSATSQFFVTLGPVAFLDDNYAVFGKVFEGLEIVDAIGQVETNDADRPLEDVVMTKVYLEM